MDEPYPWHRLFGLSWLDFFRGQPVTVEIEKDLSLKKQLLDVVLIHKEGAVIDRQLPDGFEELAAYNLVSFKSYQDKLSAWTLKELLGHYVNLRKQVSPTMDEPDLLPCEDFRLFAVCARFPRNLADDGVTLRPIREGVYDVEVLGQSIRVIVTRQLPQEDRNAMMLLYSGQAELLAFAARHYQIRSQETSSLLELLIAQYRMEGLTMPDALTEFANRRIEELLQSLPAKELLKRVSVEERLEGVSVEERLEGVSEEKRLEGIPLEKLLGRVLAEKHLEGLTVEAVLAALPQLQEDLARRDKGPTPEAPK